MVKNPKRTDWKSRLAALAILTLSAVAAAKFGYGALQSLEFYSRTAAVDQPVMVRLFDDAAPGWHNGAAPGVYKSHGATADSTHKSQKKIGMLSNSFQGPICRELLLKSVNV